MSRSNTILVLTALVAGLTLGGCTQTQTQSSKSDDAKGSDSKSLQVELGKQPFTIKGPHSHNNLTVFLLCSDKQDDTDYLTLDEGLKNGDVKVSEMTRETVEILEIDNTSDRPLYLQEGE